MGRDLSHPRPAHSAVSAVRVGAVTPNNRFILMQRILSWFGMGRSLPSFLHGDSNGDLKIDVADVVFLINYLYKSGGSPNPLEAGDASCDGNVDVSDVVFLINYLYRAGDPPPC